ncbi:MAG TPA: glycosyltransferase [Bryobacteraceae bacterium]|nr:glycosyltransferase [Bryobacteraceae bacterium]
MRTAFFSPLPPARSGIADYSAALLEHMRPLADVTDFGAAPAHFDAADFDICLYQIGNNPWHAFCYEMALEVPGVVVLHEANLHHLVSALTIERGDWDAYLREVEFDSGARAFQYARDHVRTLRRGPDYEGVPLLRRILSRSRGAVVHSRFVECELRRRGFQGPVAVIPHGAWLPEADRMSWRERLGVTGDAPLIGIFGFLKPYKRIAESLRAFRRLLRVFPEAKLILAGEVHPDLPLAGMVRSLELGESVRVTGFIPPDDFTGCMAACDVVLNLRFPTVGENSGTLMRALGLAKPVLVSDIGSFSELPEDICARVPVGAGEEDCIFEYLNLLLSRPEVAREMGQRAREWVTNECAWDVVARRYVDFLADVVEGRPAPAVIEDAPLADVRAGVAAAVDPEVSESAAPEPVMVEPEYLFGWSPENSAARAYVSDHIDRLTRTLSMIPPGGPEDRILEMGAYLQITPALKTKLGYGEVRGCYYGPAGKTEHRRITSETGEVFECDIELFDAERDDFPWPDAYFTTVLCCELLEHLQSDPMRMMSEINRVLRPGGHLLLTTPNIISERAISAMLLGYHPGFFPAYIRPSESGEAEARHAREYAPSEIAHLLRESGFEVAQLATGSFRDEPQPELAWIRNMLERYGLMTDLRGNGIYALGRKTGPVRERFPAWLYSGGE